MSKSTQKRKKIQLLNKYKNKKGARDNPLFWLYHKKYGKVPIIELDEHTIIWDDNQISREFPPNQVFEITEWSEFEL